MGYNKVHRLLYLTKYFPETDWFEEIWRPKLLSPVLHALIKAPEPSKANIPLFDFIEDPQKEVRKPLVELLNLRPDQYNYCSGLTTTVTVEPRLKQWERGLTSILINRINTVGERLRKKSSGTQCESKANKYPADVGGRKQKPRRKKQCTKNTTGVHHK